VANLKQRKRIERSEELIEDRDKITQYLLITKDQDAFKALDLLHALLTESYMKVVGKR